MNLRRIAGHDPWSICGKLTAVNPTLDLGSVNDCHLFVLRYEHNTSRAHSLFTGQAASFRGLYR